MKTNAQLALEAFGSEGSVAVIAARGRMGAMLMREGELAGLGMAGFNRPFDQEALKERLGSAKLVIFCVPARAFEDTLKIICPCLSPDTILTDITSVKVKPMVQMQRIWPGRVVGTHPLFGPSPDRSTELPVAIVPGKNADEEAVALTCGLFEAMDFTTFITDADTHDRAMAKVQNMNFITTLAYFAQTANDQELVRYLTPSFRRRANAARKMLTEDGEMFSGLFEANPYSQACVRQFSKILSLASAGDIDLLLNRARWWFQKNQ